MTTERTRRAVDQIGSWRRETADARKAVRHWRLVAAGFAAAAIALGVLAVLLGRDVPRLAGRAAKAESDLAVLEISATYDQDVAGELRKELRAARDALAERSAADGDFVERLGRAEEALAACEDHRRRDADHLAVHHDDVAVLRDRLGWLLRDVEALKCAASATCNPATIDFGGRKAQKGTP